MTGNFVKRKAKKLLAMLLCKIRNMPYNIRRFFVKRSIKSRDFTVISNNCWAGRLYQYLDMPYLSPTAGLYFFAPDYIKFVSDLRRYLNTPLRFIKAEESKYYEEIKKRNQTDKPIGILDDVEIVFLHYKTKEEAEEKWNRRKERVNYDNIILKFSRMNLCTEEEMRKFSGLPFENKFIISNRLPAEYDCEVYREDGDGSEEMITDTEPFPGKINLKKLINKPENRYPENGLK